MSRVPPVGRLPRRRRLYPSAPRAVVVLALLGVLVAACAPPEVDLPAANRPAVDGRTDLTLPQPGSPSADPLSSDSPASASPAAFYDVPSPLHPAPPGTIIRSERMDGPTGGPGGTVAYRVLYHSTSLTGADIAESGVVIVPGGQPPVGGFPILSWAHGTTGEADPCAPSVSNDVIVPDLDQLLDEGFVVAATDYEGLGTPGLHPYLVGASEGRSVLDAARAARNLVGADATDTVMIMGHSQGGHAALFAGELAPTYAPDLYIAGVVAFAPVGPLTEFVPVTPPSRPLPDDVYALTAVTVWSRLYPGLAAAHALTARAASLRSTVESSCLGSVAMAVAGTDADQLFAPGWAASPPMAAAIAENTPGVAPTPAPVLVIQGGSDPVIRPAGTTALVDDRLCQADHDTVDYITYAGANHTSVLVASADDVMTWIRQRMAGVPATNTCGT